MKERKEHKIRQGCKTYWKQHENKDYCENICKYEKVKDARKASKKKEVDKS